MDNFWFLVDKNAAVGPFDFVSVEGDGTVAVGIVNELRVIPQEPDSYYYYPKSLERSVGAKGGYKRIAQQQRITERSSPSQDITPASTTAFSQSSHLLSKKGLTIAKVTVFANIEKRRLVEGQEKKAEATESPVLVVADMPVMPGRPVRFATFSEIIHALGVPKMERPIPAGIIEMSNGAQIPISLDVTLMLRI
jgi:hypothetical protein